MPKPKKPYKESDYENKPTSLKNWLQDENLDRAAGIEPTHPGHTVDDNPRWSGVGKGDSFRPHDHERYHSNIETIYGGPRAPLKDVLKVTYKPGGVKQYKVSTSDGIVIMDEDEYQNYLKE